MANPFLFSWFDAIQSEALTELRRRNQLAPYAQSQFSQRSID